MKTCDARDVTFNTEIRDGENIKTALDQHTEFSITAHQLAKAKLNGPLTGHGFAGYLDLRDGMFHGLVWEFTSIERNPDFLSGNDDNGDPYREKTDMRIRIIDNERILAPIQIGHA